MPKPMTNADGLLLQWGDRLFYEQVRTRKAPFIGSASRIDRPEALRAQIARTVRRVPEVMVKITNRKGAQNGMSAMRAHLDYISRNGKVELEDQDGNLVSGRLEVHDLVQMWRRAGRGIAETSPRREAFNVMLSMPPGTDRAAVTAAARAFAREEFGRQRDYVFAAHDDEAHPHVHIIVLARDRNGHRLNPRKADLQRWRERFAHELRDRGIVANATPRRTRGTAQQYDQQSVRHMRARGAAVRERGPIHSNSAMAFDAHLSTLSAWRAIAVILAASSKADDLRLAKSVADFVLKMPTVVSSRPSKDADVMSIKSRTKNAQSGIPSDPEGAPSIDR